MIHVLVNSSFKDSEYINKQNKMLLYSILLVLSTRTTLL